MKFQKEHLKSVVIVILSIVIVVLSYVFYYTSKPLAEEAGNVPSSSNPLLLPSTQKIKGIVLQYGNNPQGDIDKVLIDTGSGQIWLHFPPHTAKQILLMAKLHAPVTIDYGERRDKKNKQVEEIQTISNNKNETVDIKNIPPPAPTPGRKVIITGNKIEIKKDENGRVMAFVLSNKLIALPPHTADNLLPLIISAKTIVVKGTERSMADGFININSLPLVRPDEIRIDSINYLVR